MHFDVFDTAQPELAAELVAGVRRFNAGQAGPADVGHLVVVSRDEAGGLQGGIAGRTAYRHFLIDVVWVHESARGTGLGRALMDAAEQEAIRRGCVAAQVDTLSFQAPGFYQRLGFGIIGTVPDFPAGHERYFLLKHYRT